MTFLSRCPCTNFRSNVVTLVISMIALVKNQVFIVQTSLIGTAITNMVLMIGLSFLFGGYNRQKLCFNFWNVRTQLDIFLLSISLPLLVAAFHAFGGAGQDGLIPVSAGSAVLMILGYLCYLLWAFKTHKSTIEAPVERNKIIAGRGLEINLTRALRSRPFCRHSKRGLLTLGQAKTSSSTRKSSTNSPPLLSRAATQFSVHSAPEWGKGSIRLSTTSLAVTLVVGTAFLGVCSTFALDNLDQITDPCAGHMSRAFVGVILLPFLSCNVDAIFLAMEDHLDYSFGITIGTSLQVLAFIQPLAVLVSLGLASSGHMVEPMTFYVDDFQIALLVMIVIILKLSTRSGHASWYANVTPYSSR